MGRMMAVAAAAALALACAVLPRAEAATVRIDGTKQHQTILGWGATLWAPWASDEQRNEVLDEAVNDLGLTRLRLEPPGGNRRTAIRWEWDNDNADPYDINWDAFATDAFDARVAKWVVPFKERVEANGDPFSIYVSPSFFNGGSTGEAPAWLLRSPGENAEFALSLLLYLRDRHGVTADYYCILNEAGNNNAWSAQVVGEMIKALGPRLRAAGLPTKIQFPESINPSVAWRYIETLRDDAEVWPHVGLLAYHLYGPRDPFRSQIREFGESNGLPTAQTEFMRLKIDNLYNDMTLGGVSCWELYGMGQYLQPNRDGTSFERRPHYWNWRQVMHYVRPGAVRVDAASDDAGLRVLAFGKEGRATVVLLNNSQPLQDRTVALVGLPPGAYGVCRSVRRRATEELGVRAVAASAPLRVDMPQDTVLTVYPHPGGNLPPTLTGWGARPAFLTSPADRLTLSASAVDAERDAVSFAWSVESQPQGGQAALSAPREAATEAAGLAAPGQYVFAVAVTDGTSTVTRRVRVNVFPGNLPPWIMDVHNRIPVMVTLPQDNTLLRGGAADLNNDPLRTRWSVLSQPPGAGVVLETPDEGGCKVSGIKVAGDYVFRFQAADPTHTVTEDLTVRVYPQNRAPVIGQAAASPASPSRAAGTTLLSAETADPDGDVFTHWWSVARCPAGAKPAFAAPASPGTQVKGLTVAGDYVFRLTVADGSAFATRDVRVTVGN